MINEQATSSIGCYCVYVCACIHKKKKTKKMMKVGEVFLPDDQDFQQFKTDCTTDQGWTVCYDKSSCRVATKKNSLSAFDVIRVKLFYRIN
jgi:hypothetical protein